MLDTNACIHLIRRKPGRVLRRLRQKRISDVAVSCITLSELEYGVGKSSRPDQNKVALAEFVAPLQVLPYDDLAAVAYGKLRVHLERRGLPIGSLDMLIGAHALSVGAILVTGNEVEFRRIPDLRVENWGA